MHISLHAMNPMILLKNQQVTTILIHYVNKKTGHCGVEQVLSLLQEQLWVVRGRAGVREITGGCISYKKQMSHKMNQEMAELHVPKIRLTPYEPQFTYSRVDYFGPFYMERKGCREAMGCHLCMYELLTCAS